MVGIELKMSKYLKLWDFVEKSNKSTITISFDDVESITGFKIDHSFLTYKKELESFGYCVDKISMKEKTILIKKQKYN